MESFEFIKPSPVLASYIKHYWILDVNNLSVVTERVIPTGFSQLVFHRGQRMFSSSKGDLQPQSFICGQSVGFSDLQSTGRVNMIVVVFQPFGARAVFGIPMNEFHNTDIAVDCLGEPSLSELEDKICNTEDNQSAIGMIEQFLISRLYSFNNHYNLKRISGVIGAINKQNQINITSLSDIACLSYKQFTRIFTEYVGSSPKEFSRVIRFQRALYILQNNPHINIVELAVESGYYDQPHLIREFKLFSGYTPKEFLAICNPYSDYFTIV
ncbi:MAG: helix-turn-helix domain-containing protein [Dysgonomonas sp.]|nr:helix-turn-helix domain-containing protein [Dysgonomonas sp.]